MGEIWIDFEWPIAKSYRIVSYPPAPVVPGRVTLTGNPHGPHIKPDGPVIMKRPLEVWPDLYLQFAKLEPTPENCVKFARKFGQLGTYRENADEESISDWQYHAAQFKLLKKMVDGRKLTPQSSDDFRLADIDLRLRPRRGQLKLALVPRSLLTAMKLQFAQRVSSGASVRTCEHCGVWFEAGIGTDRRADAKFCCDSHRYDFNNQRKGQQR
ncbi:MAG: hypothetical protein FJX62_24040 [Alphaproteobacteria bacterium]|nr:hypothetical protein [Alphaproteobacteria bacterium]